MMSYPLLYEVAILFLCWVLTTLDLINLKLEKINVFFVALDLVVHQFSNTDQLGE